MRIKKVSQVAGLVGGVSNTQSNSTTDAYSCNYINSIVESGSNANGSWVKYIDGTMICTQSATGTNNITQNAGASLFRSSSDITFSDFPQTFISTPVVTITLTSTTDTVFWYGTAMNAEQSTTNAGKIWLYRTSSASSVGYKANIIAIGKWK